MCFEGEVTWAMCGDIVPFCMDRPNKGAKETLLAHRVQDKYSESIPFLVHFSLCFTHSATTRLLRSVRQKYTNMRRISCMTKVDRVAAGYDQS